MGRPVDPDTHRIKRPTPQRLGPMMTTAFPDLRGQHWTKAVPPVPHGLMADVDTALTQTIFALSQREGVADRHHAREADDLRRTGEITTGSVHHQR